MRNSLYSISIEEALAQTSGCLKYQWWLLGRVTPVWTIWLCVLQWLRVYAVSSYLSFAGGMALGGFLITALTSYAGRKRTCVGSQWVGSCLLLVLQFIPEGEASYFVLCGAGVFAAGALASSYLLLIEVVAISHRNKFNSILFGSYGIATVLSSLFEVLHPSIYVVCSLLGTAGFVTGGLLLKAQETPRYLAAVKGNYSAGRKVLNHLATLNLSGGFTDILEGEKVIGNQEPNCETSERQANNGKYSFIHIAENMVSVTAPELQSVRIYAPWHICCLSHLAWLACCFILAGAATAFMLGSTREVQHATGDGVFELILQSLGAFVAPFVVYGVVGGGMRYFGLILLLGLFSMVATVWVVLDWVTCTNPSYCITVDWTQKILLTFAHVCSVASLADLLLIASEGLKTNIRSAGMSYLMLGLSISLFSTPVLMLEGGESYTHIIGVSGFLSLMFCVIMCYIPGDEDYSMEDYITEDMSEPQELPNLNFSVSQIEGAVNNELEDFDAEISLDS